MWRNFELPMRWLALWLLVQSVVIAGIAEHVFGLMPGYFTVLGLAVGLGQVGTMFLATRGNEVRPW